MDSVDELPDYPYRDDALLIWNAIDQWVGEYIAVYYAGDADVTSVNATAELPMTVG